MTAPGVRPIEIHGYAIVSDDDKIAAADGLTPVSLRNEKDWDYYQRALANSDLVVMGRRSHEFEPNVRGDLRLVLSREGAGLERRGDAWWWDPTRVSWEQTVKRVLPNGGEVAVAGGQVAFDLFLAIGFDAFHLSRAKGVKLPGGRGVFAACDRGVPAETVLGAAGLAVSETIPLDPAHGVTMNVLRRRKPAA
jgi:dihydrofolate reductase